MGWKEGVSLAGTQMPIVPGQQIYCGSTMLEGPVQNVFDFRYLTLISSCFFPFFFVHPHAYDSPCPLDMCDSDVHDTE